MYDTACGLQISRSLFTPWVMMFGKSKTMDSLAENLTPLAEGRGMLR